MRQGPAASRSATVAGGIKVRPLGRGAAARAVFRAHEDHREARRARRGLQPRAAVPALERRRRRGRAAVRALHGRRSRGRQDGCRRGGGLHGRRSREVGAASDAEGRTIRELGAALGAVHDGHASGSPLGGPRYLRVLPHAVGIIRGDHPGRFIVWKCRAGFVCSHWIFIVSNHKDALLPGRWIYFCSRRLIFCLFFYCYRRGEDICRYDLLIRPTRSDHR